MENVPPILECVALSKTYGTVQALVSVNFSVQPGEVRALLGKNGAGKSTLVNLISGSQQPDVGGSIRVGGQSVRWSGPAEAREGGIAVVHQEFSLVPGLSVAENITLGRWPTLKKAPGFIDAKVLESNARRALLTLGVELPLWEEVGRLPIAQQQLVEIAKALLDQPRVLILDEPTSALNAREVTTLLELVRGLASKGVAVIYVSHRMKEIPLVADTLTVLRDGREVKTVGVEDASVEEVAGMIAGEGDANRNPLEYRDCRKNPTALSVNDLRIPEVLNGVTFELHGGEVLGIAGLLGSGRTELLEAIFGVRSDATGEVKIGDRIARKRNPSSMLARGVGFTPEDRKSAGIVSLLGVGENILLSARGRNLPKIWIKPKLEQSISDNITRLLSIKTASSKQEIGTLSGGNQQKAVIGRLLAAKMSVLLLDEPTRGVDIHAKGQLYALVRELARSGVSSIFVSSELEELSQVCDRVIILRDGKVADEMVAAESTTEKLLALAMKEKV